jgi:hypothetical protein
MEKEKDCRVLSPAAVVVHLLGGGKSLGVKTVLIDRLTLGVLTTVRIDWETFVTELSYDRRWVRDTEAFGGFGNGNLCAFGKKFKQASFLGGCIAIHIIYLSVLVLLFSCL